MAAKPSSTTGWGAGTSLEPTTAKKAIGWVAGEKPPARYLQWLFKTIEEWLAYLKDGALSGDHTLDGHLTLAAGKRYKHGDLVMNLHPYSAVLGAAWSYASGATFGELGYLVSTIAGQCAVPIPVVEGQRLKSLVFARYGDGAADFTSIKVYKMTAAGAVSDITASATSVTNPAASWADTTVDLTDTVVGAGEVFWAWFDGSAANLRIGSIRVTYDWP